MMRRWLWGGVAITVYVTAALVVARSGAVIPRPLYDGLAPTAPYRFVSPPPDLAGDNEQPEPGKGIVDLVKDGSEPTSISTGDGQMQIVLQKAAFAARAKEKSVEVKLEALVPPAPIEVGKGLRIEGNAYRVTAAYAKSNEPAQLRRDATIVLRYPNNASVLVRREGNTWRHLETQVSLASLQLFAASDGLGVFAAAGKPHTTWTRWIPYGAGALGLIAGVLGYLSGRRGWFRRGDKAQSKPAKKKPAAKKGKRKPPQRAKRKPGRQV
jgi:hypothetical protein